MHDRVLAIIWNSPLHEQHVNMWHLLHLEKLLRPYNTPRLITTITLTDQDNAGNHGRTGQYPNIYIQQAVVNIKVFICFQLHLTITKTHIHSPTNQYTQINSILFCALALAINLGMHLPSIHIHPFLTPKIL
jgi:hypothetical protein